MLTTKLKRQEKIDFEGLAEGLAVWLEEAFEFLSPQGWVFAVDSDGKYLPAKNLIGPTPQPHVFKTELGTTYVFKCPEEGKVRRTEDLEQMRDRLWKIAGCALFLSVGLPKAKALTKGIQKSHGLPVFSREYLGGSDTHFEHPTSENARAQRGLPRGE